MFASIAVKSASNLDNTNTKSACEHLFFETTLLQRPPLTRNLVILRKHILSREQSLFVKAPLGIALEKFFIRQKDVQVQVYVVCLTIIVHLLAGAFVR